ncbi:MAG: hypothetical protein WA633_21285 [Stellaceae bacterium]
MAYKSTAATPGGAAGLRRLSLRKPQQARLVALAVGLLIDSHRVSAEDARRPPVTQLTEMDQSLDADLVLLCRQGGATEPGFKNQRTSQVFPISDARLRAIAEKACQPGLQAAAETGNVNIVNNTGQTIYVGFTPQAGSNISWGSGCGTPIKGLTVQIPAEGPCQASVTDSIANPGSRFCAASTVSSSGLDCAMAQQNNQTLVESLFQPDCFSPGVSCIWYDISVIPANCTDAAWASHYCANTGGAAYNLPVMLACSGQPTYTCKGPPFTSGNYSAAKYPSNCGNPLATCFGTLPSCVNAYFWPMGGLPQPNAVCPNGQTLTVTFLSGQ